METRKQLPEWLQPSTPQTLIQINCCKSFITSPTLLIQIDQHVIFYKFQNTFFFTAYLELQQQLHIIKYHWVSLILQRNRKLCSQRTQSSYYSDYKGLFVQIRVYVTRKTCFRIKIIKSLLTSLESCGHPTYYTVHYN